MANPNERILNLQREPILVGAGGAVNSVNGQTGDVVLTAEDVGALPDSTTIPSKTSDLENDSDYQTGDEVNQAIGLETTARENADNGLQGQIDALAAASDVTDIVGTYADLQAYDTSKLKDNDIIKVLQDENQNDETTYYRWSTSTEAFTLIGEEGPYYTKAAADQKFQDKLTAGSNITIDANNEISATDTTYSDFVGTNGQTAGTAGLVPAPATTDAGKYLKADGTWDSVSAGPNVVQATGTSQTDVMSQVATSQMIYPSGQETAKNQIGLGNVQINANRTGVFAVGNDATSNKKTVSRANNSIAIGNSIVVDSNAVHGIAIGTGNGAAGPRISTDGSIAIGGYADARNCLYSVAFGYLSKTTRAYELSVGAGDSSQWATRYIANVTDPTLPQDAATKNYTDNLVINYSAINGAAAPTTATEAKYVGQLYYDTTNDDMYYCSAITAQGTTPETYTYTWSQFGGGGVPTTATFWGASYDSVNNRVDGDIIISQIANPTKKAHITSDGFTGNNADIEIGVGSTSVGCRLKLASNEARLYSDNNTFIRLRSSDGLFLNSKRINSVADPTNAQDAATKNYVDNFYPVGTVYTSTSATAPTFAGGTWTEIGTQTIGSSTVHYYERTA